MPWIRKKKEKEEVRDNEESAEPVEPRPSRRMNVSSKLNGPSGLAPTGAFSNENYEEEIDSRPVRTPVRTPKPKTRKITQTPREYEDEREEPLEQVDESGLDNYLKESAMIAVENQKVEVLLNYIELAQLSTKTRAAKEVYG